jgi:hypothetical protein
MRTVEDIKVAAAALSSDEQQELFEWWIQTPTFRDGHLQSLKRLLDSGLDHLRGGQYEAYDDANIMRLAEEVGKTGRKRLEHARKKPKP